MLTATGNRDARLSLWLRVRECAVPPSMIETATARRHAGDWAGACAAAGIDVDLDLRGAARTHGRELAARLRADLRRLAPDLLRWHMPRIAPDGVLRPGLTIALARYDAEGDDAEPAHLVARTPPAWADAGQRFSLALWDGSRSEAGARRHPHPHPSRRFRLDLHRHLWDAHRAEELRTRSGADRPPGDGCRAEEPDLRGHGCAVDRWAAEAGIVLRAEGRSAGSVAVRLGTRRRLVLDHDAAAPALRISAPSSGGDTSALPVLPDAATWVPPDLELVRAGLTEAHQLHPLVAAALLPDHPPLRPSPPLPPAGSPGQPRLVQCRGAQHRIGLVDGEPTPLDHDPAEIRREELLAELTGTPLPCLQAVDAAREEREAAARQRITYGLYRAGLFGPGPGDLRPGRRRPRDHRTHPRHATRP
ncbi:hypothetical protein [Streptomyces chromofuscus]|uniref:Uncharacterized protein n=1 Tax=Streptomyces chromofuscus TaxID=42881 RepID=A0A7M2T934_STRCW|nr:hypothetical protein [Streptomyces chromofuscus]QOV45226.1 hypothetical protein IPT68_04455 [Streptomyces chromofuscus]GGS99347.1 hypothetical protein GCM10010254_19260 [Streptomyces chromofuscus]